MFEESRRDSGCHKNYFRSSQRDQSCHSKCLKSPEEIQVAIKVISRVPEVIQATIVTIGGVQKRSKIIFAKTRLGSNFKLEKSLTGSRLSLRRMHLSN
jgi:hypothetical protein